MVWFEYGECEIIVWCLNDYFGMGQDDDVIDVMYEVIDSFGVGFGGMCNIFGMICYYVEFEKEFVDLYGKFGVLLFIFGYVFNDVILLMLGKILFNLIIYLDVLNYVLMIEGIWCFGVDYCVFCYNDVDYLCVLIENDDFECLKVIVFESVYLMDGDVGLIEVICDFVDEFDVLIYFDEVYVVGMYGEEGVGVV